MAGKTEEKPNGAGMSWEQFQAGRGRRGTRRSKYAGFIEKMEPRTVYNASAAFPGVKPTTLQSAIYGQAKSMNRKVQGQVRDGILFVALA